MVAVIVHNVLKQVGLRLGTGIGMFEWRNGRVYLVIAMGALGLLGIQVIASPPIYVSLVLAALISLIVLWANRELLEVDQMFPELMRIPGLKFLVTGPQGLNTVPKSEGRPDASSRVPPSDGKLGSE